MALVMNLHSHFIGVDYYVAYALAEYEYPGATSSIWHYYNEKALREIFEVVL